MIVGIALSGCASTGASVSSPTFLASAEKDDEPKSIADPNEKFNRSVFDSNQDFNHSVLYPTAKAYNENVPEEVRDRIDAFTTNLNEPMVFANIAGFWNPMLALIDHMREEGFVHTAHRVRPLVVDRAEAVVAAILAAGAAEDVSSEGVPSVIEKL